MGQLLSIPLFLLGFYFFYNGKSIKKIQQLWTEFFLIKNLNKILNN
jgi:hypothetical protein